MTRFRLAIAAILAMPHASANAQQCTFDYVAGKYDTQYGRLECGSMAIG